MVEYYSKVVEQSETVLNKSERLLEEITELVYMLKNSNVNDDEMYDVFANMEDVRENVNRTREYINSHF